MTNDDHLESRSAEAELQRTSRFVEAVNKDDVIGRLTKKYGIIERLESHSLLNNIMPSISSQNSLFLGFFFLIAFTLLSYFSDIYSKYSNVTSSFRSVH